MNRSCAALAILLLVGPASCVASPSPQSDDTATEAAPSPSGEAKELVKQDATTSGRRTDPAADEVFQRYVSLVHYPATEGWKSVTGKGEGDLQGSAFNAYYGIRGVNPNWTPERGFSVDVTLSEFGKAQAARTGVVEGYLSDALLPLLTRRAAHAPFDFPVGLQPKNREHFNVTLRQDGDDTVVEMTPFDDKADAKLRRYVFGKDGLLKSSAVESASGTKLELDWRFKKWGERYVIAWIHISDRARHDAYGSKFEYYDGPDGGALLKQITFWDRGSGHGEVVSFHDYVVDGKLVETTMAPTNAEGNPPEKPAETPPVPKADK